MFYVRPPDKRRVLDALTARGLRRLRAPGPPQALQAFPHQVLERLAEVENIDVSDPAGNRATRN